MANFVAHLAFQDINQAPAPKETDLLFYDATAERMARGWITTEGDVVLIGGQWKPTHWAEHFYPIANACKLATRKEVQASQQPNRLAFDSIAEKYLIVQRNSVTQESEVVAQHNSEFLCREAWANWTINSAPNCWYEFVLNTKARPA